MYYKIWKFSDWKFHALIVYSFSIDIDKQIGCSSRKILIFTSHKFYPLSYENARTHVALTVKKKKKEKLLELERPIFKTTKKPKIGSMNGSDQKTGNSSEAEFNSSPQKWEKIVAAEGKYFDYIITVTNAERVKKKGKKS